MLSIDKLKDIAVIFDINPIEFFTKSDDIIINNSNCNQAGINHNYISDKLLANYERTIENQQKEIDSLRKLLEKSLNVV